MTGGLRVGRVLLGLCRHAVESVSRAWNWKAALLGSACRAPVFLAANLTAGLAAGAQAMVTEFLFRVIASGVLGNLTQRLRGAEPAWAAAAAALLVMPALGHTAEYLVHSAAGTPRLGASLTASIAFTGVTTLFNLFVMRRGVLVSGAGGQSLARDVRALPGLVIAFVACGVRAMVGAIRAGGSRREPRRVSP